MGGALFASGPNALVVPRLPSALYYPLKEQYTTILKEYYAQVTTPYETPGKESHGDIDIMACDPLSTTVPSDLAAKLEASRTHVSGCTTSFAVPHPYGENQWVQLDLHICRPGNLAWEAFDHSYGDLLQIIGVCIRPLGFTATDRGFFVRVAEIEEADRKGSFIFLTDVPDEVLGFLGLDAAHYNRGFTSETEIFAWVTSGAFYAPDLLTEQRSKSNDRRRKALRPMYQRFIDEWVGGTKGSGAKASVEPWSRQTALERAVERFGKRDEYEAKISLHRQREQERRFWERAQKVVPLRDGEKTNLVVRALIRWVDFETGDMVIRGEADMSEAAATNWAVAITDLGDDVLIAWIEANWEEVQRKEKARIKRAKSDRAAAKTELGVSSAKTAELPIHD